MAPAGANGRMSHQWRAWWDPAPDAGIYIGAGCLATAAIEPSGEPGRLRASRVDPLPAGAVTPSPLDSNIRQPDAVIDRLREAAGMSRRKEVTVSLPDLAVRVAIVELAQVPAKRAERDALFQHRLEQLFLNSLGRCRFAHQRLPPAAGGRERLLISAIRREILEEYESVVRAAGLLPAAVDISAFHLYNLYEPQFAPSLPASQWAMFVNLFDRNFTIILMDRYGPRFIRVKALPDGLAGGELLNRVMAEVEASVRAAHSAADGGEEAPQVARLFCFSDRALTGLEQEMRAAYQAEITDLSQQNGHLPHGDAPAEPANRQALMTAMAAAMSGAGER